MRVMLTWSAVQPIAPRYAESDTFGAFQFYNTDGLAQKYFGWLDEVISLCNSDGIFVNLCLDQYHPAWAAPVGSPSTEPGSGSPGKPSSQRLPAYVGMNTYWGQWVAYVYNRYHGTNLQGVLNRDGPSPGANWGNPSSAWIGAFEFGNEPNYYAWNNTDNTKCTVFEMFNTVDSLLSYWGPACGVLGPATADVPARYYPGTSNVDTLDGVTFTQNLLGTMTNFRPANYFAWSHHNYRDMHDTATSGTANTSRLSGVASALNSYNWRGGGDRNIWVTEGGYVVDAAYSSADVARQNTAISKMWPAYKTNANAVTYPQYLLNNAVNETFRSGMTYAGTYPNGVFTPGPSFASATTFKNLS
jgi:hypothetical protein